MIPRNELKKLSEPSLFHWGWRMCVDWSFIGLLFYFARSFNNPLSYVAATLLMGFTQHAIAILGHDGTHRRISKNLKLNDFLTEYLSLAPMMMPLGLYRDFHFSHHRYLGTEKDGEVMFKKDFSPMWDLPIPEGKIRQNLFWDSLGVNFWNMIKMGAGPSSASFKDQLPMIQFWSIALIIIGFTGTWWMLPMWFTAIGSTFWASFRFRLWCEHMGTKGTYRFQANWLHRTFLLPHNIDIHWEHHRYPSVSLWNLPKVRKMDASEEIVSLQSVLKNLEKMPPIASGQILNGNEFKTDHSNDFEDFDQAI